MMFTSNFTSTCGEEVTWMCGWSVSRYCCGYIAISERYKSQSNRGNGPVQLTALRQVGPRRTDHGSSSLLPCYSHGVPIVAPGIKLRPATWGQAQRSTTVMANDAVCHPLYSPQMSTITEYLLTDLASGGANMVPYPTHSLDRNMSPV